MILIKLLLIILLVSSSVSVVSPAEGRGEIDLPQKGYEIAFESSTLLLYINPLTAEFAVKKKDSGQIWFSNPIFRDTEERISRGTSKQRLASQFSLSYYTPTDMRRTRDSFNSSVDYNQFDIQPIDGGVRVEYILGRVWEEDDYLPRMISAQRVDELWLAHIEDGDTRNLLLDEYYFFTLVPAGDKERIAMAGIDKERLFGEYTLKPLDRRYEEEVEELNELSAELTRITARLEETGDEEEIAELNREKNRLDNRVRTLKLRVEDYKRSRIWDLLNLIRANRRDIERLEQITWQEISQLVDNPTYLFRNPPFFVKQDMVEVLQDVGYTPEDVRQDHMDNNINPPLANVEIFTVAVEYLVEDDQLVVRVPAGDIEYPRNVLDMTRGVSGQVITYYPHTLQLLNFFGAASETQEGYIFVPDGAGSLIYLNNEKLSADPFGINIYGRDQTFEQKERFRETQQAYLPVFGMKQGDQAFLAIIEEGEALARIRADIAGRTNSYNTVFAEFTLLPQAEVGLELDRERKVNIYQSRTYQGDFQIRYVFLEGKDADYVGMANFYRDYLQKRYSFGAFEYGDSIPFYMDVIAAISDTRPVLGITREVTVPLTSFTQTQKMAAEFLRSGVENLFVRYRGWLKGGLRHQYPRQALIEKALGTEEEFLALAESLTEGRTRFYPQVDFLYVRRGRLLDGFSPSRHASRTLARTVARRHTYNMSTYLYERRRFSYILSPNRLETLVRDFLQDYGRLHLSGFAPTYMGLDVNSDFRREEPQLVDRQQSAHIQASLLEDVRSQGYSIMLNGANAHVLPYAEHIVNMPLRHTGFNITDQSVPFMQIALRGLVHYGGSPLNLTGEERGLSLLRLLETGSSPYYIFSYSDASQVKETEFDHYFSIHYRPWLEGAVELYKELNSILGPLQGQSITGHKRLETDLYRTEFEDGTAIIVNYSLEGRTFAGEHIPGLGYKVMRR